MAIGTRMHSWYDVNDLAVAERSGLRCRAFPQVLRLDRKIPAWGTLRLRSCCS